MYRHSWILSVVAASSLGLAGCGETEEDTVAVEDLVKTTQQNLERSLRGVHDASSFTANSSAVAKSLSSISGEECTTEPAPCAVGTVCPEPVETCTDSVTVSDLAEGHEDLRESIDELLQKLRDEVFIEANRESSDGDSVTYRFDASLSCESSGSAADAAPSPSTGSGGALPVAPPPAETDPDAECKERAARLQPRLRLSSAGPDTVTIQYLIGSAKNNPVTFELSPRRAAVHLDLDELEASIRAVGEDLDGVSNLSGKLELELLENAARDYSARLNVLEALSVTTENDDGPITITLGPSKPTFELRVNGNTQELTGKFDLGAFSERGPLGAFRSVFEEEQYDELGNPLPEKSYTGNIDLSLAGYEGAVTLDGSEDRLAFKGLGFGDTTSTLKFDGTTIAALDVNPNHGRHFDLSLQNDGNGQTTLGFSPTLDLSLFLNFTPLASQIADLPNFALGDTLRLWFEGANPSLHGEDEQLRVVSGTLNLSSTRVPAENLVVPAGSCLLSSSREGASHELLGELSAGPCQ